MREKIRVAINGFGRIGRMCYRNLCNDERVDIVAINDLADAATLVHLLRYDSIHGRFPGSAILEGERLVTAQQSSVFTREKNPELLPWKALKVDIVIESSGHFTSAQDARTHVLAGASKVLITAPGSGGVKTIVPGVNSDQVSLEDVIISNASCTTNCLAPMVKVLHEEFGILKGYITTIHAYTADQRLHDAPHKDLRRARAAAISMIPTTTGAARAVGDVFPSLAGKLDGVAVRVPVPDGSITDLVALVSRNTSAKEVNDAIHKASMNSMKGIIQYITDPIVSIDVVGNTHSCIFDSSLTAVNENLVKVMAWYDNEAGYSQRVCDLIFLLFKS